MLKRINPDGTKSTLHTPGEGTPKKPRRYAPGAIDKQLKENRAKASLDKMGSDMLSFMLLNGLTNQEMAALLSGMMVAICNTDSNKKVLEEMGLDTNSLETVLEIQKLWAVEYASQSDPED